MIIGRKERFISIRWHIFFFSSGLRTMECVFPPPLLFSIFFKVVQIVLVIFLVLVSLSSIRSNVNKRDCEVRTCWFEKKRLFTQEILYFNKLGEKGKKSEGKNGRNPREKREEVRGEKGKKSEGKKWKKSEGRKGRSQRGEREEIRGEKGKKSEGKKGEIRGKKGRNQRESSRVRVLKFHFPVYWFLKGWCRSPTSEKSGAQIFAIEISYIWTKWGLCVERTGQTHSRNYSENCRGPINLVASVWATASAGSHESAPLTFAPRDSLCVFFLAGAGNRISRSKVKKATRRIEGRAREWEMKKSQKYRGQAHKFSFREMSRRRLLVPTPKTYLAQSAKAAHFLSTKSWGNLSANTVKLVRKIPIGKTHPKTATHARQKISRLNSHTYTAQFHKSKKIYVFFGPLNMRESPRL